MLFVIGLIRHNAILHGNYFLAPKESIDYGKKTKARAKALALEIKATGSVYQEERY